MYRVNYWTYQEPWLLLPTNSNRQLIRNSTMPNMNSVRIYAGSAATRLEYSCYEIHRPTQLLQPEVLYAQDHLESWSRLPEWVSVGFTLQKTRPWLGLGMIVVLNYDSRLIDATKPWQIRQTDQQPTLTVFYKKDVHCLDDNTPRRRSTQCHADWRSTRAFGGHCGTACSRSRRRNAGHPQTPEPP